MIAAGIFRPFQARSVSPRSTGTPCFNALAREPTLDARRASFRSGVWRRSVRLALRSAAFACVVVPARTEAVAEASDVPIVEIDSLLSAHNNDFNAALGAAVSKLSRTGGVIYLSGSGEGDHHGEYQATSRTPITRREGAHEIVVTTRSGNAATVVQRGASGDLLSLLGAHNLRIENLRLIGSQGSGGNGVVISNCQGVALKNVHCRDTGAVGIRITSASNTKLTRVKVSSSRAHGVRISNCTDITLDEVTIVDAGGYGIGVQSGTQQTRGLRVLNSKIVRSRGDGIDIKGQREDGPPLVLIEGLKVVSCGGRKGAALDLRGHVAVKNVQVRLNPGSTGLRFRLGTDIGTHKKTNGWAGYGYAEQVTIDSESPHGIGIVVQSGGVTLSDCSVNGPVRKKIEIYEWANGQRPVVVRSLAFNGINISNRPLYLSAGGSIYKQPKLVFE